MVLKIKNIIIFSILFIAFSLPLFAQNYGEIISYTEKVLPYGSDAIISATITATANDLNEVYIPFNKNAKLIKYTVKSASTSSKPELIKINGKTVYKFTMSHKLDKYEIEMEYKLSGLYKGKKAKMKDSYPGGVNTVSYKFANNLPVNMKTYKIYLYIPERKELYQVLTPSKKFEINADDIGKYVSYKVSKVAAYGKVEIKINLYSQSSKLKVVIWIVLIILSIFLLIKRFDVIKNYKKG